MIPAITLLAAALWNRPFTVDRPAEVTAAVTARCGGCSWASPAKTGAMLVLEVDGRYSQHLPITRGEGPTDYAVSLGRLAAGTHRLAIRLDRGWTPRAVREVSIPEVRTAVIAEDAPQLRALAFSPVLHPRPNELGRFTDVPLVMWYETDTTARSTAMAAATCTDTRRAPAPAITRTRRISSVA